jgi:hypothetical protein
MKKKLKRGRPWKYGEPTQRYQVTIPSRSAAILRRIGNSSLSAGVMTLVERHQTLMREVKRINDLTEKKYEQA